MPTTYAHYRFGCDVFAALSPERQNLISAHRDLYDFGVHGPDLLFYYKPLGKNPVNQKGYGSHARTGRDFFTEAAAVVQTAPDGDAARAYLYGVLCHFALDRECHPYVAVKEKDQVSHSLIESSFDRYLMVRDGLDPVTHDVTAHLHPSRAAAAVIAPFYSPVTAEEVYAAERQMVFYLKALIARGAKRGALLTVMRAAGQGKLGDMFVPYDQEPRCVDSDLRLYHLYEGAVPLCVTLIEEMDRYLSGGEDAFGPGYDHTFGEN